MNKQNWDNRFHVADSRDNHKVHEFYRQYFDKPSKQHQDRISVPANPSKFYPNLSSTLDKHTHRIPEIKRLGIRNKKTLELGWNPTFQVKISKDNMHFYSTYREYFDTTRIFDHNVSVVNTIPISVHGFKKNDDKRYASADPRSTWNHIYTPISENNNAKYRTLRNYFDSFKQA
ncbi:hypothetical protein SteCoe_26614 [Stentor coeruleus]|uniref:Uncharacterized protein n=1 Tax=Stentor coeruleus TaxID=5963 RepID=A0A1R2BCF8_9CILI|nr:hypothetical protein SteCoe_26614 [Stentor coeruleus]